MNTIQPHALAAATSFGEKQAKVHRYLLPQIKGATKVRLGPAGIHVFDRITGLNLLFDEVQVPPSKWAVAPRQLSVALTNACDLACPYCYASKKPATQDFPSLVGWLDELDANGCLAVGFGGGEPTLYPRFAELCRQIATNTTLAVTFTTHGHWIDAELASQLAGNVHFVRVSMDGVGETYEALRGRSFLTFCERVNGVRQISNFGINFVVNSRTLPDLDDAIALSASMGAAEFLLLPEQATKTSEGIDEDTRKALRGWVEKYHGTVPLAVSQYGAEGLPTCDPLPQEKGLRAYAHVSASGFLKQSSYANHGVAIGRDGLIAALAVLRSEVEEGQ